VDSNSQSPKSGSLYTEHSLESANDAVQIPFGELWRNLENTVKNNNLIGPTPHVIQTISEIRIQRLEKRIRKLIEQRDHYKDRVAVLTEMLKLYPFIMNRWEDYQKRKADMQRLRDYDKLVPLLERDNDNLKAEIKRLTEAGSDSRVSDGTEQ
jgi:hypothetical protein